MKNETHSIRHWKVPSGHPFRPAPKLLTSAHVLYVDHQPKQRYLPQIFKFPCCQGWSLWTLRETITCIAFLKLEIQSDWLRGEKCVWINFKGTEQDHVIRESNRFRMGDLPSEVGAFVGLRQLKVVLISHHVLANVLQYVLDVECRRPIPKHRTVTFVHLKHANSSPSPVSVKTLSTPSFYLSICQIGVSNSDWILRLFRQSDLRRKKSKREIKMLHVRSVDWRRSSWSWWGIERPAVPLDSPLRTRSEGCRYAAQMASANISFLILLTKIIQEYIGRGSPRIQNSVNPPPPPIQIFLYTKNILNSYWPGFPGMGCGWLLTPP